jgi:hypothetical protein
LRRKRGQIVPDAIVSNDVYPITRNDIETIPLDDVRATFEAVVVVPVRLTQLILPAKKERTIPGDLLLLARGLSVEDEQSRSMACRMSPPGSTDRFNRPP